jgi:hypothetical protein
MDSRSALLAVAHAYSAATGRSLARVGTVIHDQGAFFKKLEAGHNCTMDTFDKAMRWFSDNWPSNACWPDDIRRPAPREKAA